MSKTVDQRVVEMRFDNKDFEKNVQTSMSTLEKLKSALKLDGVSNGLKNLSNSAKKVDFSGMTDGIETVNARFSAMQVVGMTALSNITSAAMRAGTNLVKSFTIEPITSGFKEYELQMNSIQTILANTKSKGTTMDQVTAALNELNEYADLTIYNFAEMTKNIGTFTAAGVDLDTSVGAIKGIANLGAMSSSTSAQVSTAMYQLSQALATGRVSLMDWNSVVNAGMGGEQFQNALKRTAENFGYDVDSMIKKYGSFRESLTQGGWLTAEVLTETLNQIGGAYDENALRAKGYSEENIKAILDMAQTATDAATDVKTFTQLMDTLNEAVGSGWAQVWQNVFGDFEEAKEFFSSLHEMLEPIVTGPVNAINEVISAAMGMGGESRWGDFTEQLDKAGVSVDTFQKKLSEVASGKGVDLSALIKEYGSLEKAIASGDVSADMITETLKELAASTGDATVNTEELNRTLAAYQKVVDDVWYGTYGNVDTGRIERLKEAGWEYAEVQKLVNMTVDGHRLTLEDLSAAQIVSLGYTQEQADALVALAKEAEAAGEPMNTLINDILNPKRSGRELFLEGLTNTLTAIIKPLQAVGAAFGEVFGLNAEGLYNLIDGFNKFSKSIIISDEDATNLQRTFKGLFSIAHILSSTFGNTFVVAIKAINAVLAPFGTNILAITGFLGDGLYELDRWITSGNFVEATIDGIGTALSFVVTPLQNFVSGFTGFPVIEPIVSGIANAINSIIGYFSELLKMKPTDAFKKIGDDVANLFNDLKSLKWSTVLGAFTDFGNSVREFFTDLIDGFKELGPDILEGLQNGLTDGVDAIFKFMQELGTKIIETVKAILGIHSPSTVFFEIGKNIIDGLCNGIEYMSGRISQTVAALIEDIKEAVAGVDWGAVFTVGAGIGSFIVLYQFTDALQGFATAAKQVTAPAQSAAGVMNSVKTTIDGFNERVFGKDTTSKGFQNIAQGVLILSQSIAILAGSVAVLSALDQGKMWGAVGAIAALAAIIGVLAVALNKFANGGSDFAAIKLNSVILSLGASFLLMAVAARIIGGMEWSALGKAGAGLVTFTGVITALIAITKFAGPDIDKVPKFIGKISTSFLLLSVAAKILGTMSGSEIDSATIMLATFTGIVAALILVTELGGEKVDEAASFLSKIGTAFLLLSMTAKILGTMSSGEMDNATVMLATFSGVIIALILVTQLGGKHIDETAAFLSKVGVAFLLLGITARLLGGMSEENFVNAQRALLGLTAVIGILILITNLAPKEQIAKISGTLLAMALSIGIIAGIAILLGYIDETKMEKGIKAVALLSTLMAILTAATGYAGGTEHTKSAFMGMAVAIGVMVASIAVLSLLDRDKVYNAATCLSLVMAMFAVIAKAGSNIQTSVGVIVAMAAVLSLLSAALYILAGLPSESLQASAVSLSVVLLSLAGALKILNGVGKISGSAFGAMAMLTGIMVALAGIFGVMSYFNIEASLPTAIALSAVLTAMAAACVILGTIKSVSTTAMAAIGVLIGVMAGLGIIFGLMSAFNVEASIPNAIALSVVLEAMAVATLILSKIGAGASAAVQGAAALAGVVGIITAVIAAIVGIAGMIGQISGSLEFINQAGEVLKSVGNAIGSFVAGIGEGLTSTLPQIGANIGAFATNIQPLFTALSGVDSNVGSTLQSLGVGLLALTSSGLLDQLTQFFGGESNFDTLKTNLPKIGEALSAFSNSLTDVNLPSVALGAQAFKTVAEAMSQVPNEGGLLGSLLGGKNYEGFGTGMASIGEGLASFDTATSGVTMETLQTRVNALKVLMDALSVVPNSGGLLQDLLGTPNYSGFGTGMGQIGSGMASFDTNTSSVSVETIQPKVEALKLLMDALSVVPNTGGLLQDLLGTPNYSGFGTGMGQIGSGLAQFYTSASSIKDFGVLDNAVNSLKKVIETLSTIPVEGGWLDKLLGNGEGIDYEGFANGLSSIAEALVTYSEKAANINAEQITSVTNVARNLINFVKGLGNGVENLEEGIEAIKKVEDIGTAISAYSTKLASVDPEQLLGVNGAIEKIISLIESMAGMDTSGVATFQEALTSLAETNVDGVVTAFSEAAEDLARVGSDMMKNLANGISESADMVSTEINTLLDSSLTEASNQARTYNDVGIAMINSLASGIEKSADRATSAVRVVLSKVKDAANGYSLYSAGYNISLGLAQGISAGTSNVIASATSMVSQAIAAANKRAGINSPSKVFYQMGDYMVQGLTNALDDDSSSAYAAGRSMTEKAVEGARRAAAMLSTVVDSDLDATPTITPVLDLNNVQSGVAALDGMLSGSSLGILGQVNSISRSMNSRNQNGVNADVVSALDRVYRKLDDMPVNQYNVNGITYDDGSNIARTVGDLTRQLRIERRS